MTTRNGGKHLSEAELGAVLSYVGVRADLARRKGTTRAVVDELVVLLLAGAGLRPHELCALRIGDLPETHGETALWIQTQTAALPGR
jgi:integrase